jgi:nitroimidazol reductase NimA-like FMN-containing flavoprotein (pyridoxamine 5'-phosphate oxidase superfamily)
MSAAGGKLSPEEIDEFLAQPIIARIGTVKPDGAPHVAAIWQQWDGGCGSSLVVDPAGSSI